jgi:hypothetical protein
MTVVMTTNSSIIPVYDGKQLTLTADSVYSIYGDNAFLEYMTMTTEQKKKYEKAFAHVKKMMHVCSPIEYNSYKKLMNYYYNKLN